MLRWGIVDCVVVVDPVVVVVVGGVGGTTVQLSVSLSSSVIFTSPGSLTP
jgi:hypothetical protein